MTNIAIIVKHHAFDGRYIVDYIRRHCVEKGYNAISLRTIGNDSRLKIGGGEINICVFQNRHELSWLYGKRFDYYYSALDDQPYSSIEYLRETMGKDKELKKFNDILFVIDKIMVKIALNSFYGINAIKASYADVNNLYNGYLRIPSEEFKPWLINPKRDENKDSESEWLKLLKLKIGYDKKTAIEDYCKNDAYLIEQCSGSVLKKMEENIMKNFRGAGVELIMRPKGFLKIKKVVFNDPATIVFWKDGTKTVVKAHNEKFDKEKGLAMAISKKVFGNNYDYFNTFKRWIKEEDEVDEASKKSSDALNELKRYA